MDSDRPLVLAANGVPAERNPYLVYVGGLDKSSRPTMKSVAKLVTMRLSSGAIEDPAAFPWPAVNYGVLRRLRAVLVEDGRSYRTVNKALTLVRNVVKQAWLLELVTHDHYERLLQVENLRDVSLPKGRIVDDAEIAALLAACDKDDDLAIRDGAIVALLAGAGLRENEAAHVLCGHVDLARGEVLVKHGKRRKERGAYLERGFDAALSQAIARASGGEETPVLYRVAPSGRMIRPVCRITTQAIDLALGRLGAAVGLRPFTPHDLRRSFITRQLTAGVDPIRLARTVGHASPKTTMIYDLRTAESDRLAIRGGR